MNARYNLKTSKISFSPKHFSKYVAVYNNVTFSDMQKAAWAQSSIEALAARGIVSGIGNSQFNPSGNITRAEFVQMLMKAFELNDSSAISAFSDVKDRAWYYNSIATAHKLGIISGKTDESFGVKDQVTRQDMAVMIYKTAALVKITLSNSSVTQFADKNNISGYAVQAVEAMQKAGIISGVGGNEFAPKNNSTRAQAATIIYKLFSIVE
jgi:hypothetical protein